MKSNINIHEIRPNEPGKSTNFKASNIPRQTLKKVPANSQNKPVNLAGFHYFCFS